MNIVTNHPMTKGHVLSQSLVNDMGTSIYVMYSPTEIEPSGEEGCLLGKMMT